MMYLGLEMAGGRLDDDAVLVASLREESRSMPAEC
jgi:hypothetical protein